LFLIAHCIRLNERLSKLLSLRSGTLHFRFAHPDLTAIKKKIPCRNFLKCQSNSQKFLSSVSRGEIFGGIATSHNPDDVICYTQKSHE